MQPAECLLAPGLRRSRVALVVLQMFEQSRLPRWRDGGRAAGNGCGGAWCWRGLLLGFLNRLLFGQGDVWHAEGRRRLFDFWLVRLFVFLRHRLVLDHLL